VFPQILGSFAWVFELVLDEMLHRFWQWLPWRPFGRSLEFWLCLSLVNYVWIQLYMTTHANFIAVKKVLATR
jgi:hypothetical protein